jgi:hypothetical protein
MSDKKEETTNRNEIVKPRETTVSSVASNLAGLLLEESVRKGKSIEIPSLGITLTKEELRKPSKTGEAK